MGSNWQVIHRNDREAYRNLLRRGYTRVQLAEILGISRQAITRWKVIPLKHVTKLSKAIGISREHLRPSDYT
jgi:hypothetical protein